MVIEKKTSEAWVRMPSSEDLIGNLPSDRTAPVHQYDFGTFFPAMARLIMAHGRIGANFGQLFSESMFSEA